MAQDFIDPLADARKEIEKNARDSVYQDAVLKRLDYIVELLEVVAGRKASGSSGAGASNEITDQQT